MSQRLKLIVAYDGGPYSGWQSQASGNAIQDHLERAFQRIAGERVRVHGAGRTDSGVHALAQCAHVDLTKSNFAPEKWLSALNGILRPTIRVLRCNFVSEKFHARFSAKGKVYRYRIWSAPVLVPLEVGRAWHVIAPLDVDLMRRAAKLFIGEHDFASFSANRGAALGDTKRTLRTVTVRQRGAIVTLEFDGEGFLYKMARLMTGSIVQCGVGKISCDEIAETLFRKSRGDGPRLVAPAAGLFLVRVRY